MYNYLSVAKLDHVVQQFTDIKEHYNKKRQIHRSIPVY